MPYLEFVCFVKKKVINFIKSRNKRIENYFS